MQNTNINGSLLQCLAISGRIFHEVVGTFPVSIGVHGEAKGRRSLRHRYRQFCYSEIFRMVGEIFVHMLSVVGHVPLAMAPFKSRESEDFCPDAYRKLAERVGVIIGSIKVEVD